jgi:hypothetical protein
MSAKPKSQFTVWLKSSGSGPSRAYLIKEQNGDKLLRTFTAVVHARASDESLVASWCEIHQDKLPTDGGIFVIEEVTS